MSESKNKYAVGITDNGRPPIYKKAENLKCKIIDYFESLIYDEVDDDGNLIPDKKPTVTGLALFLGFASRQSMYDYSNKEEFSYIIKRAQMVIEMSYEEKLHSQACTGSIFALKNMGWSDKTETEITNKENKPEKLTFED